MAIELERFKTMNRVDFIEDDAVINGYLMAAKNFVINAIGRKLAFYEEADVVDTFETAVYSLAGTYYTYRATKSDAKVSNIHSLDIDETMNAIVGQLRGRYAEWEEEQDENG